MDARSAYLKRRHTPTPFSQGPEMKNYSRMMELQSQAPNFAKNDPRFDELKAARRQYNREDKYKIGERFNVAPLDVQKDFSDRTNVFRNEAPNVYRKMYPFSDLAMRYGESGGLLGLAIKGLTGDIGKMGSDISSAVGIAGAVDDTPEEQADYVGRTFGFYPTDVHPELQREEGQLVFPEDVPLPSDSTADIIETDLSMENLPYHSKRSMFPRDNKRIIPGLVDPMPLQEPDYPTPEPDYPTPEPIEPLPFDDSAREAGIMSQYPTNFIGPRDDPSRRPDMYDVAGPRLIDRGLIPYPGYSNDEVTEVPYYGRGEMPQPYEYGFSDFYRNMGEGYGEAAEYNLREKELLDALASELGASR